MLTHTLADPAKPGRVVVIGAGGFVGGEILRRVQAAGIETLGLARGNVDLLASDAAERLAAQLRPGDAIVAVAARAPCKNIDMMVENMVMVRAMVKTISAAAPSHVINISSDAVYGDEPVPLSEDAPPAPGTLHGAMHLAREIAFATEINAPLAILRPTLLYGARDPHNGYGPNRFRRLAQAGEDITLFGGGEEQRDHVLIDDLAEIALRVLLRRSTGSLNVATGEVHSFKSIAEQVVAAAKKDVVIKLTQRSGPMPHNGYRPFDTSAIRAAFPDFEYVKLPEGLLKVQALTETAS